MATAAVAGAGALMGTYGKLKAAQDESLASARQVENLQYQARESYDRHLKNINELTRQTDVFKQSQIAGFAKGNVNVGTGVSLDVLNDTAYKYSQEVVRLQREEAFKQNQMQFQQMEIRALSKARQQAAYISAVGGGLLSAGQIAEATPGMQNRIDYSEQEPSLTSSHQFSGGENSTQPIYSNDSNRKSAATDIFGKTQVKRKR